MSLIGETKFGAEFGAANGAGRGAPNSIAPKGQGGMAQTVPARAIRPEATPEYGANTAHGARDHATADDHLAPVEHDRLARRDGVLRLVELDLDPLAIAGNDTRGHARGAVPHPDLDVERIREGRQRDPDEKAE